MVDVELEACDLENPDEKQHFVSSALNYQGPVEHMKVTGAG